ncbi:MAG TPA: WG repeat-containing protein [Alistipes onderdonkii]|jgi:hypothetical protein|nr:WG repeat-containing protein [Alistipes onderdonkii]HJF90353.1 WG repeat-containing protein [Alistipes onderdonkii]
MKRLATLLAALLCLQSAASGAEPWFRYFSDGRAVIKRGSLYGFADRNGTEAIPCRHTKAYPFNDGIAMVRQGYEVFTIDTLKKSPRWTPGTANGVPVDVRYETSFKFQYR